ncbi:hypothetical protein N9P08_02750 [Alphaproteobacteria bacterium]|nr:hypothetical protein [Alphaproteobacteria bacterium]
MTNNFLGFLLVIAIAAPLYALLRRDVRIFFLVVLSFCFYAYFDLGFVTILGLIVGATYLFSFLLYNSQRESGLVWIAAITVSLPLLFYKYLLTWFKDWSVEWLPISSLAFGGMEHVLIPVGLSFYTFQCLGYLVDLNKKLYLPEQSLLRLAAFVSFFPQILAGPIERYPDLSKQLFNSEPPHAAMVVDGVTLLFYGIFLKLAVAERLVDYVNLVFTNIDVLSSLSVFLGFTAFTLQIFADFGGYSFIALGTAALFGVRLTNNFIQPFCAVNMVDFWQRWHVSLTRWVGDYVYRPIALNLLKKSFISSRVTEFLALFATWLIIGMWHGALFNFAAFGFIQGVLIIITSYFRRAIKLPQTFCIKLFGFLFTMFCVVLSFGLIRAPDFTSYCKMLDRLFSLGGETFFPSGKLELLISLSVLVAVEWSFNRTSPLANLRDRLKGVMVVRSAVLSTLVILIAYLGYDETSAFIYFQY